jgi:hypothetical protein
MKSIMQDKKDHQCYICLQLHGDDSTKYDLEEHHVIYGFGRRKLSEKYGLKVMLCRRHHRGDINGSRDAVHGWASTEDIWLKRQAQRAWEKKNTVDPESETAHEMFRGIFGKSYL